RNDATLGYKYFVRELDRLAYTDLTAVIRLPGERWSSRPVATAPTGHRLLGSPKTRAGRGCFAYEHHRPAIAYSRVGTGRTPSAVPSSTNFRASLLGSDLGLIAQPCRAFFISATVADRHEPRNDICLTAELGHVRLLCTAPAAQLR